MRPNRCPSVRATFGSCCGPITISATMAMTSNSENPMSNMLGEEKEERRKEQHLPDEIRWRLRLSPLASLLGLRFRRFLLRFAVDGLAGAGRNLRLGLGGLVFLGLHAVLEALHGGAQVGAQVAQLLGAEDHQYHHQHDQPVPDAY